MCTNSTNGSFIKIGNVYLIYDSSNNAIKVAGNAAGTTAANFYATGAVSALGANSSSGGGGTSGIPLSGSSEITGSLILAQGGNADLGSSAKRWRYVYGLTVTTNSLNTQSITASGNASISGTLAVSGVVTFSSRLQFNGGGYMYGEASGSTKWIRFVSTYMTLNGTNISSDMRLKNIINYTNAGIEQIADAPIFNFYFKNDIPSNVHLGTSAQYWKNIFPCAVITTPDGYLSMDYGASALAAAVITARKVQNHEDRILKLERENEQLRNEIKQLKAA